jgi:RNA polymerase sigma-70 factor (sigma-E family)
MLMTFDTFVTYRLAALLRLATALTCDPHLAQDIVQDVLLRALPRWKRIGSLERPEAYVQRMVINEFLSWRRRASRVLFANHDALDHLLPAVSDPTVGVGERDALIKAIAKLPAKQRAAIVLRYFEHQTDEEIADLLECSQSTVRSHVFRGLATLRTAAEGSADIRLTAAAG